jgi:16S rRNA (cytidine1402-2'-O)-methyltransferase
MTIASEHLGCLYLVPVPIGNSPMEWVIPNNVLNVAKQLDVYIAENAKTARAFLKSIQTIKPLNEITVLQLSKHDSNQPLIHEVFRDFLSRGINVGLVSESGMPSVADPGSEVVKMAHIAGFEVRPLVGPSSLLLALAASGLNGQKFSFHGYLPKDKTDRKLFLKELEINIRKTGATHLFIETPYRNEQLFSELVAQLSGEIRLCVASDLTGSAQYIRTLKIDEWRKVAIKDLTDIPTVFLLG